MGARSGHLLWCFSDAVFTFWIILSGKKSFRKILKLSFIRIRHSEWKDVGLNTTVCRIRHLFEYDLFSNTTVFRIRGLFKNDILSTLRLWEMIENNVNTMTLGRKPPRNVLIFGTCIWYLKFARSTFIFTVLDVNRTDIYSVGSKEFLPLLPWNI